MKSPEFAGFFYRNRRQLWCDATRRCGSNFDGIDQAYHIGVGWNQIGSILSGLSRESFFNGWWEPTRGRGVGCNLVITWPTIYTLG